MAIVELKDVTYKYPLTDLPALKNINLQVNEGEFVAIVGPNGAGKSTLCYAIAGFVPHFFKGELTGTVEVLGLESHNSSLHEWVLNVGLAFQNPFNQISGAKYTVFDEGEEIGIIWGAVYMGLDANGKYLFDDGTGKPVSSDAYKTQIGRGLPKFEMGWTNTFHYGNFDLNFFLRGSFGHDLVNTYRAFFETSQPTVISSYNAVKTKYFDPALKSPMTFSSLYVEKASFVKLDNLTLGYDFNLKSDGAIKGIRAFLNGQNLFVITDYTGVDPEVRYSYGGNILAPGVDARDTYVRTRSYTLGVNLKF